MNHHLIFACAALFAAGHPATKAARDVEKRTFEFESLDLHYEVDLPTSRGEHIARAPLPYSALRSMTAELALSVRATAGIERLRLLDAYGCVVAVVNQPKKSACGMMELDLEWEGATLTELLNEYPPGAYQIQALSIDGESIERCVHLYARFPAPFAVTSLPPDAVVPHHDVTLSWTPARGAVRYVLEVEQPESGFELTLVFPPTETKFTLPAVLLEPNRPYEYSLVVQGDTDNELELEGRFTTTDRAR